MKTPVRISIALLGAFIQAVGLCNIHAFADVTEGGVLGATLLIEHWFSVSPALSALALNVLCYLFGWKTLGGRAIRGRQLCGSESRQRQQQSQNQHHKPFHTYTSLSTN